MEKYIGPSSPHSFCLRVTMSGEGQGGRRQTANAELYGNKQLWRCLFSANALNEFGEQDCCHMRDLLGARKKKRASPAGSTSDREMCDAPKKARGLGDGFKLGLSRSICYRSMREDLLSRHPAKANAVVFVICTSIDMFVLKAGRQTSSVVSEMTLSLARKTRLRKKPRRPRRRQSAIVRAIDKRRYCLENGSFETCLHPTPFVRREQQQIHHEIFCVQATNMPT